MKIKKVSKIYKTKTHEVKALENVSFDLPEKGLVFVIGKSGSGKSTLLNILGGLDSVSSGEVVVDGVRINELKNKDLEDYRLNYLGFIFQDFCLIDNLTVYENVELSLNIANTSNKELILSTLEKLEILDQKDKFANELSAGQKQRVAIARAIVKKAKVILCDEPTGNLDNKTGKQILEILKEISASSLVVIVSHNLSDAYTYGDRIIELLDGKIINDLTRDFSNKDDKTLTVSDFNNLDAKEIDEINNKLKTGKYDKIVPLKYYFSKTNYTNTNENLTFRKTNKKLSFLSSLKLSFKLFKKKFALSMVCSLITSLVMGVLYLSQSFISFDEKLAIEQSLNSNDQTNMVFKKAYYDETREDKVMDDKLVEVTQSDLNLVNTTAYQGDTYLLYNYSLPISLTYWTLQNELSINDSLNLEQLFIKESYGVLVCDEQYISQTFFEDQEIEYVIKANQEKDYGIYITDYIADSMLFYRPLRFKSYNDIVGSYKNESTSIYAYINGIINTNYKIKHQEIINNVRTASKEDLKEIYKTKEYCSFIQDITNNYGICYSTNTNFINDSTTKLARNFARIDHSNLYFPSLERNISLPNAWAFPSEDYGISLNNMTLSISLSKLNELFNENFSLSLAQQFIGNISNLTVMFSKYPAYNKYNVSRYHSYINVAVHEDIEGQIDFLMSDDLFTLARKGDMIAYATYFDDASSVSSVVDVLSEIPYIPVSLYATAAIDVAKIVGVFDNVFSLILVIILIIAFSLLAIFSFDLIKKNKFNIGVMKSIGGKTSDISKVFIPQIIFTSIICILFFSLISHVLLNVGNVILISSFMSYNPNPIIKEMTILLATPSSLVLDILLIAGISLLSILIPIIYLRTVKPIEIIRNK